MEETNSFVLSNVSKNYIVSKSQIIDAINNISLTLPNKGMIFVVGRSGSGKSTLLNLLGRLDKPSSGCVYYHGSDLHSFDAKRTNLYLGNEVSFIFQEYYLLEDLSVSDNMKIAFGNSGMTRDEIERKITSALSEVGLSGYQNRKVSHLSGGEKQRIGIARAIVKDAKVILCDEPTGNLDVSNAEAILNALKRLSFKKLVVVVTHEEDLAKKYSQRTIRLSEGNILEDINWTESNDLQLEPALIEHIEEPLEKTNRPTYRKPLFSILWSNFKNTVFSSILTFLVLCVSVVVMATFIAISQYDSYDTFIDTLEFNDTYLVKVTSYIDHSVFIGDEIFLYGLSPTSERVGEGDAPEIEQLAQNLIPVAKSYYFVKHFQDFIDYQLEANQYGSYSSDVYHKTYFTDVIIVDDFSTFNQPLRYGNYPELDNEILIYDFMAMQLINTGVFPNFNSMADLVGYTLADKDTGLEITISGILSSHYGKYAYTSGGSPAEYPFESLYLSELQSIFAISGFKNLVLSEQKYVSFNSLSLYNASTSEITSDFYMRKIIILDSLETLDFILAPENVTDYGLLLSDVQVANMLGVDVSTITPEFLLNNNLEVRIKNPLMDQSRYQTWISTRVFPVSGIYRATEMNADFIYGYYPQGLSGTTVENGEFRNIYLSLDDDWKINTEALKEFMVPEAKSISFYYDNPSYEDTGYMEYSPYSKLIAQADQYMQGMKNTGTTVMIIVIWLCAFLLLNYTYRLIQKGSYRIGVLKSLGYSNLWISIMFGSEVIILSVISFAFSIFPAIHLTSVINQYFIDIIHFDLIFFSLSCNEFILTFVGIIFTVIVALLIPLFFLIRKTPIRIITDNRERS